MIERCSTIAEALRSIRSLEELEGFMAQIAINPEGNGKQPTEADRQRMATMRAEFELAERKKGKRWIAK